MGRHKFSVNNLVLTNCKSCRKHIENLIVKKNYHTIVTYFVETL